MEERSVLARNIRNYRRRMGLTLDELGKLVGRSKQAISFYEIGKTVPRKEVLSQLASVFEVEVSDLFEDKLRPKPELERDENYLLLCYRSMDVDHQEILVATAKAYADYCLKHDDDE